MVPKTYVNLDRDDAVKMLALMDVLESHDDVSRVYANFDVPDDILDANV
jgi:transcriptional/translational regulatory protein YebC/TACO1